jgi:molecular chaperone GrpE
MKKDDKNLDMEAESGYNPVEMDEDVIIEESGGDTLKKLREKLKKCVAEKQEYLDGWQRAKADFINFKKGEEVRVGELMRFAKKDFIVNTLPVLDSLNVASGDEDVERILEQFLSILKKEGVEEINPRGVDFDPNLHEAVEMVDGPEGEVVEVSQKGYTLNGKVIRAARVKVGK